MTKPATTPVTDSATASAPATSAPTAALPRRRHRSRHYHRQRKQARLVRGLALAVLPYILFLAGLTLVSVAFFSYVEHESVLAMFITQRDNPQDLLAAGSLAASTQAPSETTPTDPSVGATGRLVVPFFYVGDNFGTIRIPDVEIEAKAYQGDSEKEFRQGVGHYTGSYFPGQGGNILIAGHRTSFFRNFEYLEIGDLVYFETTYGDFTYQVESFRIIDGDDQSIAAETDREQLTMYTCYPFTYVGNAPQRYVVTCVPVAKGVA